jgi:Bacterial SH3 domain
MKYLLLILCIFSVLKNTQAQEEEPQNSVTASISQWQVGDAFTLVTDANVREKPTTQSMVVTKLPIGSPIKIEEVTTDSFVVNGFKAPWCKIIYTKDSKEGYLWGGFIATVVLKDIETSDNMMNPTGQTEGVTFLGGVSAWDEKKGKMTMQLRAMRGTKEITRYEFVSTGDLSYEVTLKVEETGNFKNVLKTLSFSTGYPACGYPWSDNLIFYKKDKTLTKVLETTSIGDGGVMYASENYILPYDKGGIAGHIIVTSDQAEFEEKGNDLIPVNQKYSLKLYKWDGLKLIKMPIK